MGLQISRDFLSGDFQGTPNNIEVIKLSSFSKHLHITGHIANYDIQHYEDQKAHMCTEILSE